MGVTVNKTLRQTVLTYKYRGEAGAPTCDIQHNTDQSTLKLSIIFLKKVTRTFITKSISSFAGKKAKSLVKTKLRKVNYGPERDVYLIFLQQSKCLPQKKGVILNTEQSITTGPTPTIAY